MNDIRLSAAQPRVERNGFAMGKQRDFVSLVSCQECFGVKTPSAHAPVMRHIAIQQVERSDSKNENNLSEFESKVQRRYSGNDAKIRGDGYHGVVP
jgi:hypothetical protein